MLKFYQAYFAFKNYQLVCPLFFTVKMMFHKKKVASSAHNSNYPESAFSLSQPPYSYMQKCFMSTAHFFIQNVKNPKGWDLMKLVILTASSKTYLSEIGFLNCINDGEENYY